jgi:hypothetical protein
MFRPFRIIMLLALGLGIYAGFFQTPKDPHVPNAFDPDKVANFQLESWKAIKEHRDFAFYFNMVQQLREQHRYTWWKAASQALSLSRATTQFAEMHNRYERVMGDLEDAAEVERSWTGVKPEPNVLARAQLDWWVSRKMPGLDDVDRIGEMMANEWALRYNVGQDRVVGATYAMAAAMRLRDDGGDKPDWVGISRLLNESYRNLKAGLTRKQVF